MATLPVDTFIQCIYVTDAEPRCQLRIFSFAQPLSSDDFKDFDCLALVQHETAVKKKRSTPYLANHFFLRP